MNLLIKAGRFFYGLGLIVYGILQFRYKDFRAVIVPPWPGWLHTPALAYISGAAMVVAGFCIAGFIRRHHDQLRYLFLLVAAFFFVILLFCHVPLNLFISPNSPLHLGVWANALKELAFCGGALVMATSYQQDKNEATKGNGRQHGAEPLETIGRIFFSTTMILFGVSHFYYTDYVAPMVPRWFGMPIVWTYIGGTALIGAGICIILKLALKQVALLLALMLFIWFWVLHIPNALTKPTAGNGNEIASAFDALLFCGVALAIYYNHLKFDKPRLKINNEPIFAKKGRL